MYESELERWKGSFDLGKTEARSFEIVHNILCLIMKGGRGEVFCVKGCGDHSLLVQTPQMPTHFSRCDFGKDAGVLPHA